MVNIAYFITPHGFGHTTRACAVMEQLAQETDGLHFEIFSTVPEWLIQESLVVAQYTYHPFDCDLGLVQKSPFEEDEVATIGLLKKRLPFSQNVMDGLISNLQEKRVRAILCDIAPIGIEIGKILNLPTMLIENFTWDWIYQGYDQIVEEASGEMQYLKNLFAEADFHIQTEPVCNPSSVIAPHVLQVKPAARKARKRKEEISHLLQTLDKPLISISMGGIAGKPIPHEALTKRDDLVFVMPGMDTQGVGIYQNIRFIGNDSGVYHPDLIAASDLVLGKMGYSTYAETWCAGAPFVYILRERFRESGIMDHYAREYSRGEGMSEKDFLRFEWLDSCDSWMNKMKSEPRTNGVDALASFIERSIL